MKKLLFFAVLVAFVACKKEPPHPDVAKGSLQNQYGECLPSIVHGIYTNGIPLSADTGYVDVAVYVTSPGTYTITSVKQNGVTFAATGNFTDTGVNTVRLKPSGTFTSPGTFTYPFSFDSSTCQFTVEVQDSSSASLPDNSWTFTAQGHVYKGPAVLDVFDIPQSPGVVDAEFNAHPGPDAGDTVLQMSWGGSNVYNHVFDTATRYPASMILYLASTGKRIYVANIDGVPRTSFDIHFSANSPHVVASFNGTVVDSTGNLVPITNARFKVW